MGARAVFQTRNTPHGPEVRAYGDGRDSGWLDVTEQPIDDSPLALVVVAASEHGDIQDVIDGVIWGRGSARLNDQPLDPRALSEAAGAWIAAQRLDKALPESPPASPGPRL